MTDKFLKFFKDNIPILIEIISVLVISYLLLKIIDFCDKKIRKHIIEKNFNNTRLLSFCPVINKVIKTIVLLVIIASVMQSHGYSMASVITGLGITGIAVGFAAKESLASFIGSFAILYDKIYDINDYIVINNVEGTVVDINLRSTKIKTLDNSIITIPNNIVADSLVTNVTATKKRRINCAIGIVYNTSDEKIEQAIQIIKDIITGNNEFEENPMVYLEKLNSSSIDIRIMADTIYPDFKNYTRVRENFILTVIKEYRKEGIEFAFPTQTLYLNNEN